MESLPEKYQSLQSNQVDEKIAQLIILAGQHSVSVEALKDILAMGREMKAEYAKEQYDKDMTSFQADCPIIIKNKFVPNNSGGGYRFATIDSIVSQVKHLLAKYNFSYSIETQIVQASSDGLIQQVSATCTANHILGHSKSSTFPTPLLRETAMMNYTQRVAGTFTFAKRYAFCNIFGIMTGDDDTDAKVEVIDYISGDSVIELRNLLAQTQYTEEGVLKRFTISKLEEMKQTQADIVIEKLKSMISDIKERNSTNG